MVFNICELNIGRFASVLGLLKVPKIKEARRFSIRQDDFKPSEVNPDDVPFVNPHKETNRANMLKQKEESNKRKREEILSKKENKIKKKEE